MNCTLYICEKKSLCFKKHGEIFRGKKAHIWNLLSSSLWKNVYNTYKYVYMYMYTYLYTNKE